MNEQELRSLVERMVLELAGQPNAAAPAKATPVTAAAAAGGCLDDITETDLRRQYLVKNPRNGPAFLDLKLRTPARLGLGRAGARYQTLSMLRMPGRPRGGAGLGVFPRGRRLCGKKRLCPCPDPVPEQGRIPDPPRPGPPL